MLISTGVHFRDCLGRCGPLQGGQTLEKAQLLTLEVDGPCNARGRHCSGKSISAIDRQ